MSIQKKNTEIVVVVVAVIQRWSKRNCLLIRENTKPVCVLYVRKAVCVIINCSNFVFGRVVYICDQKHTHIYCILNKNVNLIKVSFPCVFHEAAIVLMTIRYRQPILMQNSEAY